MRNRFLLLFLLCLGCLTATMGGRFNCEGDNPDCEFFCDDD